MIVKGLVLCLLLMLIGVFNVIQANEKIEETPEQKTTSLRATAQQWMWNIKTNPPTASPAGFPTEPTLSIPTRPTSHPTSSPSSAPTSSPSEQPSSTPSTGPSGGPSSAPSQPTSPWQWNLKSKAPTASPAGFPIEPTLSIPTRPTSHPTGSPSSAPTSSPSEQPSSTPSTGPSGGPSSAPSQPTSPWQWNLKSKAPTASPAGFPTEPTLNVPTPSTPSTPSVPSPSVPSPSVPSPSVPSPSVPSPSVSNITASPTLSPSIVPTPPGPAPFPPNTSIIPIVITGIDLFGVAFNPTTGELTATGGVVNGTIGGIPFTTNILNFVLTFPTSTTRQLATPSTICGILNLELGPIHVELLGLHIDTSSICVEITGIQGGGLLADLLCGLAGGDLTSLPTLLDFLRDILTGALSLNQQITPRGACNTGNSTVCTGACEVLSLVIGPVDLFLLGLHVHVDNCNNQAVRACVSATRGQGVLGDLLCGLAGQ